MIHELLLIFHSKGQVLVSLGCAPPPFFFVMVKQLSSILPSLLQGHLQAKADRSLLNSLGCNAKGKKGQVKGPDTGRIMPTTLVYCNRHRKGIFS